MGQTLRYCFKKFCALSFLLYGVWAQNTSAIPFLTPQDSVVTTNADTTNVIINEFLTDPPSGPAGDVNGDGISNEGDQFIEIINKDSAEVNLSGWKLSNDGGTHIVYTFPDEMVLSAHRSAVIFGGGKLSGNFEGAIVQRAGKLNLKKSFGEITLLDDKGMIIQHIKYGKESAGGQSLTLDPQNNGSFVRHSLAKHSMGSFFSPGTKADGSAFGLKYAMSIERSSGWRMISSPLKNTSFQQLLGRFGMQGINESKDPSGAPTIYSWIERQGGKYVSPAGMTEPMETGKGYIVYFTKDDEPERPGVQGSFPKLLTSDREGNNKVVTVSVSATDADGKNGIDRNEGWNLLGNPFGSNILVSAVIEVLKSVDSNINANMYVWDQSAGNGNGIFKELAKGDVIAPFEAFFVRYTVDGIDQKVPFNKGDLTASAIPQYDKQISNPESIFELELKLHGKSYFDTYSVMFNNDGSIGLDRYDGYKLFSLNSNSVNLFSTIGSTKLQKNVLPLELETTIEIPLSYDAKNRKLLTLSWRNLKAAPRDWDISLTDKKTNRIIDLRAQNAYSFRNDIAGPKSKNSISEKDTLLNKIEEPDLGNSGPRFILSISPKTAGDAERQAVKSVVLKPNYPNPFSSGAGTTIPFELDKNTKVTLTVWNMIGQKVATLIDGETRKKGSNEEHWNGMNLPSGLYIGRLEVDGQVYIRKMTLIK